MGDKFLDLLWDRLSPEYKVAAVEGNWSTIYIVMPEADYNDYAEDLADSGSTDWSEIFENIMDEYPVFDVLYKNGKIQLFASNDQCEMEFNPDDEDAEYKEYDSLDDFEKMDDPDAEEDLCKLDGTEELTVEEVSK